MQFGRYNLVEHIASGGMADVYRAEVHGPHGFVKEVAVKLIRSDFGQQPEVIEMFLQEARLASKLTHANIVQVFDFGQGEGGRYYTAMEFVRGRTISQIIQACRSSKVPVSIGLPRAIHVCAQVAMALDYAHRCKENGKSLGLVHRDVSPQNVLISFEGEVKLADFGIARAMNSSNLTEPGTVKGKPAYMAPEQALGRVVDFRTDLFSLGIVLWELCCGMSLFKRESNLATIMAVVGPEPAILPPSKWNSRVPAELDAVVASMLERDPSKRPASAKELANQLQTVLFKLSESPDDFDLRSLMAKLWPEGVASTTSASDTVCLNSDPGSGSNPSGSIPKLFDSTSTRRFSKGRRSSEVRVQETRAMEVPSSIGGSAANAVSTGYSDSDSDEATQISKIEDIRDGSSNAKFERPKNSGNDSSKTPKPVSKRVTPRSLVRNDTEKTPAARDTLKEGDIDQGSSDESTDAGESNHGAEVVESSGGLGTPVSQAIARLDELVGGRRNLVMLAFGVVALFLCIVIVIGIFASPGQDGNLVRATEAMQPRVKPLEMQGAKPTSLKQEPESKSATDSKATGSVPDNSKALSSTSVGAKNGAAKTNLSEASEADKAATEDKDGKKDGKVDKAENESRRSTDRASKGSAESSEGTSGKQTKSESSGQKNSGKGKRLASKDSQGDSTLEVVAAGTWAVIFVDGKKIGFTPTTVTLPSGKHLVRAEHEGLNPVEYTITLEPGETTRWSPRFAPK